MRYLLFITTGFSYTIEYIDSHLFFLIGYSTLKINEWIYLTGMDLFSGHIENKTIGEFYLNMIIKKIFEMSNIEDRCLSK
jgi:hypothetical protein